MDFCPKVHYNGLHIGLDKWTKSPIHLSKCPNHVFQILDKCYQICPNVQFHIGHLAQSLRHFAQSPGQNWTDWTNAPNLSSILSNPVQP